MAYNDALLTFGTGLDPEALVADTWKAVGDVFDLRNSRAYASYPSTRFEKYLERIGGMYVNVTVTTSFATDSNRIISIGVGADNSLSSGNLADPDGQILVLSDFTVNSSDNELTARQKFSLCLPMLNFATEQRYIQMIIRASEAVSNTAGRFSAYLSPYPVTTGLIYGENVR